MLPVLDAFSHLNKRVCTSVGPSVGPSVCQSVCQSGCRSVGPSVTHELKSCKNAIFDQNFWQCERGRILCCVSGLVQLFYSFKGHVQLYTLTVTWETPLIHSCFNPSGTEEPMLEADVVLRRCESASRNLSDYPIAEEVFWLRERLRDAAVFTFSSTV